MSPNERSAEFYRGAVESHINTCNLITSITSATKSHPARQGLMAAGNELHNQLDRYRTLLAAAEAREATQPTALPSVAMGGTVMAGNKTDSPTAAEVTKALEKAHWIGCSPHEWPTVDDIPLLCHALIAEHSRATTAAEVVEACRVALELGQIAFPHLAPAVRHGEGCICARCENHRFAVSRSASLALCARWKEANGGH